MKKRLCTSPGVRVSQQFRQHQSLDLVVGSRRARRLRCDSGGAAGRPQADGGGAFGAQHLADLVDALEHIADGGALAWLGLGLGLRLRLGLGLA
jgi:hypothetical protein